MWKVILVLAAFAVIGAAWLIQAADAAIPGQALYRLDRRIEALQLAVAPDEQAASRLKARFTRERLDEMRALAERGDDVFLERVVTQFSQEAGLTENGHAAKPKAALSAPVIVNENNESRPSNQGEFCNGSAKKNHPAGDQLAEKYTVSYIEIMGWFCQGYGFGDIQLAYHIQQQTGAPVEEVFARRAAGLGWGDILQAYNLIGKSRVTKSKLEKTSIP